MIIISTVVLIAYSALIVAFIIGFDKIKLHKTNNLSPKNSFTIIIPFRNEALNLSNLLNSLVNLNYPKNKFEIILINDNSTDDFKLIIADFKQNYKISIQLIDNIRKSNSPKKDAITIGVKASRFDWIITTDADCIAPTNWLKTIDDFIQVESPKMIVAPVTFKIENNFISKFQTLDFLSLQGSTMGGFGINKPFLCNGANLIYSKSSFLSVNGFSGNNNIASGDDIFLLEKMILKFPKKVNYLKSTDVIVYTKPEENWNQLFLQRIRWASKTTAYKNTFGSMVGLIVFTSNFNLILLFILATLNNISWQYFGLFFLVKFNLDFFLIYKTSNFFKQQQSLKSYLICSLIHPVFTVIIALFSFKKGYQWKGRYFKK